MDIIFQTKDKTGRLIRLTGEQWKHITHQHSEIIVNLEKAQYSYIINSVTVVEPEDTSVLAQNFSDSFITIITCTPPGTVWKRLIIKARIKKI